MRDQRKEELRNRAEQLLRENPIFAQRHQGEDLHLVLNELQIYQAELEVQNEELRQTQQQLIAARDRFSELYDFAPVGYVTLDAQGIVHDINFAGAALLGLERRRVMGTPFARFLDQEGVGGVLGVLKDARESRCKQSAQLRVRSRTGEPRHVQFDCLFKETQKQYWVTLSDIELLKQAQEKAEEWNRDLERRVIERTTEAVQKTEALRLMGLRLNQIEQEERKRIASELHDYLAQILVFAGMQVEAIRKRVQEEDCQNRLQELSNSLEQARQYTRTLMADMYPRSLAESGLRPAVQHLAEQMQRRGLNVFVAHQGELLLMPEKDVLPVFQSIRELLINVIKHAHAEWATVTLAHDGSQLHVTVADNGCGMDAANLQPHLEGQGHFGLFSVRERMESLGGKLWVESSPGAGTEVHLQVPIPLIHSQSSLPSPPGATPRPRRKTNAQTTLRVLVVDDHAMVRRGLCSMIRDDARMIVIGEAADGAEAVEAASRLQPDAIIMDVNMPRMDGIEATRRIKSHSPETQVFGISFQDDAEVRRQMHEAGASGFISKGASADEVWKILQTED